jgi:hypothetical protein
MTQSKIAEAVLAALMILVIGLLLFAAAQVAAAVPPTDTPGTVPHQLAYLPAPDCFR